MFLAFRVQHLCRVDDRTSDDFCAALAVQRVA